MVWKKSNWCAVNSGNTMRRRFYRQVLLRHAVQEMYVMKTIYNIRINPLDLSYQEVDAAENYIDDGGLKPFTTTRFSHLEYYSLNKKKRWQLDGNVSEAVYNEELANEPFKVTLVHRVWPTNGMCPRSNSNCNVTHYYDSHSTQREVRTNRKRSTRLDLARKADMGGTVKARPPRRKIHPAHNVRYRGGIQRKHLRIKNNYSRCNRTTPENTLREDVPEIRYEVAEPEPLNSSTLSIKTPGLLYPCPLPKQPWNRFRGFHRQKVAWYCDYISPRKKESAACNRQQHQYATDSIFDGASDDVEDEEDTEQWLWSPPPPRQEYSLFDLLQATQCRQRHKLKTASPSTDATTDEKCAINTATTRTAKKHGKGTSIFIGHEHGEDSSTNEEEDFTDEDSGINSSRESDPSSPPVTDYQKEFAQFDHSFCSCGIPDLEMPYLQDMFSGAVAFAKCVPLTVKFDLQAVWKLQQRRTEQEGCVEEVGGLEEWWLLCQVGEGWNSGQTAGQTGRETELVKLKLFSSQEGTGSDVAMANGELRRLVTCQDTCQPLVLPVCDLLDKVCRMLRQLAGNRQSHSVDGSTQADSSSGYRVLDVSLPHHKYTGQVEVCSIKEAYLHLLSASDQSTAQSSELDDLALSCSLSWRSAQCSVCFSLVPDRGDISVPGFTFSIALTTCGHSFCRLCWQQYLVSSVLEGKTTLHCMMYQCETKMDSITVMSLVPKWVYNTWQQRIQNYLVESSGQWKWCPNAHCGRLARALTSRQEEKTKGVPVACKCCKRWCLDCGRDAHWPLTCPQFSTYTKMLRQNGEEDGIKTTCLEITSVQVKRCPHCQYPIEKKGGCSHMSCSRCQNSFCWVCLSKWSAHVSGDWLGCREKKEETIRLENERVYPVPIECYQKAVTHRFALKQLESKQHRILTAFQRNYHAMLRHKGGITTGELLYEDVMDHVINALQFLKKGLMLLELCFILLSNSSRRHRMARLLSASLPQLHFMCDRVDQHLRQPVKQVLRTSKHLHMLTSYGHLHVDHVCLLANCLVTRVQGPNKQAWLLQGDHERFVKYK